MKTHSPRRLMPSVVAVLLTMVPVLAFAEDAPVLNSGDTAWMISATALVLFMTIPGLALFTPDWCVPRTCSRC